MPRVWVADVGSRTGRMDSMTNERAGTGGKPVRQGKNDPLGSNTEIARKLKQYYDDLVTEEVPDRFADLLSKLESAEMAPAKD